MALSIIAMALIGAAKGATAASNPAVTPAGGAAAGAGKGGGGGQGVGDMIGGILGKIGQEKSVTQPDLASPTFGDAFGGPNVGQQQPVGIMDRIQKLIDARKATLGGYLGGG